jgi:hypothetical protein
LAAVCGGSGEYFLSPMGAAHTAAGGDCVEYWTISLSLALCVTIIKNAKIADYDNKYDNNFSE